MSKIREKIEEWLNDRSLRVKMRIIYVICVLLPIIVTDGAMFMIVSKAEKADRLRETENTADAVYYELVRQIEVSSIMAANIAANKSIREYLDNEYKGPLDYFVCYDDFKTSTLFSSLYGSGMFHLMLYSDNDSIVNGGFFSKLSTVKDSYWYYVINSEQKDERLLFYYDTWQAPAVAPARRVSLIRRFSKLLSSGCEKIIKIDMEYTQIAKGIMDLKLEDRVYVCKGDDIILSNTEGNDVSRRFSKLTEQGSVEYSKQYNLYGEELTIYVMRNYNSIFTRLSENTPMVIALLFFNFMMPTIFMNVIETSITSRLKRLGNAFESRGYNQFRMVNDVKGKDEIGVLMNNYNIMVDRQNALIERAYTGRIKAQEAGLAQQRAELLALYSQINPHFLFNALENIRMQSILKHEDVTADMIGKLAIMERQYVDWSQDKVETAREIELTKAYLELQKYRFGDRLSYEVDCDEECEAYIIPKLSIVTFVENACVHGIEKKSDGGWIFVRVSLQDDDLVIEIEDTGTGLSTEEAADIRKRMHKADIRMLQENKSVGIVNACLRIKMLSDDSAAFELESEESIGTTVTIRIPKEHLRKGE
ncbi:MAG: sensor histidine kinase [Lachnospiraceae bacterium]|nr:sensor histidine kinase [Lachnospiraceae bacterium]